MKWYGYLLGISFFWQCFTGSAFSMAPQELFKEDPAAVVMDGRELFQIKTRTGLLSAQDRAELIQKRIEDLAADPYIPAEEIETEEDEGGDLEIRARHIILLTITEADADAENKTMEQLTEDRQSEIRDAVLQYRKVREREQLLWQIGKAVLLTSLFVGMLFLSGSMHRRFWQMFHEKRLLLEIRRLPGGRWLPLSTVRNVISYSVFLFLWLFRLLLLYFYVSFILGLFPWTAIYSQRLLLYVEAAAQSVGAIFLQYLPDLGMIILLVGLSFFVLKIFRFFFSQIKAGKITLEGFYPEWADSTYKIVRFIVIIVTIISVFPYIPGSQSLAFQGISVFLGVLLSLGSSSAVSNVVAGVALIYTRSYSIGDRVQMGEHTGDVIEKSLLATRIRTIKNEDITIPNAVILNNPVINFSSSQPDEALILHAEVTISYEVSPVLVQKLLIEAACATEGVLQSPEPFVFQKNLGDVFVNYEINAYTDVPAQMADTYSFLYENILETFHEAQIELLTPQHIQVYNGMRKRQ